MADAPLVTSPVSPPPSRWRSGRAWGVGVCILWLPVELLCFVRHLFGILVWLVLPGYARIARLIPCRHGDSIVVAGGRVHPCLHGTQYRNRWLLRFLCGQVAVVQVAPGKRVCVCGKDGVFRPPLATFIIFAAAFVFMVGSGVWVLLRLGGMTAGAGAVSATVAAGSGESAADAAAAEVAGVAPVEDAAGDAAAFAVQAREYLAAGQPAEARIEFKNAVAREPKNAGLQVELGISAWKCGRLPEAWQCFVRAIELDPRSAAAEEQLARLALARGEVAVAAEHAVRLCVLRPEDPAAQALRAQALLAVGKPDVAREAAAAALRLAPDQVEALMTLAGLELAAHDAAAAEPHFRRALELQPELAAAQVGLARTLVARQAYAPAIAFLDAALQSHPDRPDLLAALCDAQLAAGHADAAVSLCNRSLAHAPVPQADEEWLLQCLIRIGEYYSANGDADAANCLYRDAVVKRPAFVELLRRRAVLLAQCGAVDEACTLAMQLQQSRRDRVGAELLLADLYARKGLSAAAAEACARATSAGKKDPRLAQIKKIRARAALTTGHVDIARGELEEYLAAGAEDLESRLWLAACYRQLGRVSEATKCLQTAAEKHPTAARPLLILGQACLGQNDTVGAMVHYRQVLQRTPAHLLALNNLACLLSDEPQGAVEAKALATKAYELYPRRPMAVDTLGWVLFRQGDVPRAVSLLREAVALRADQPTLRYHLAEALQAAGQSAEAGKEVVAALALQRPFPESKAAEMLRRKLEVAGDVPATVTR